MSRPSTSANKPSTSRRAGRHRVTRVALAATTAIATLVLAPASAEAAIPDGGLPPEPVSGSALVSERTEILQSGVTGENSNNDTFPNTDIQVTAITQIGDVMYIGGKFTGVQRTPNSGSSNQRFLAAFDRNTGAWIDTFRPTLNGNVWDLKRAPDGDLIVAGQFTTVNGSTRTGIAKLDPNTGNLDTSWNVELRLTGSSRRVIVRAIDIEGDRLYLGGNFTRIRGSDGNERNAANLARVDVDDARGDGSFLPNINGIVFDVDADGDRVYAVGNLTSVNGVFELGRAVLRRDNGQNVAGIQQWVRTSVSNTRNSFQQAILSLGTEVWQVGAQHNFQAYRAFDYQLLRSFVSDPFGDGQALEFSNGIVYAGNHGNGITRMHTDATRWPELTGSTSSLPQRWLAAWDNSSKTFLDWYPQIGVRNGEGAWELFVDSADCLWVGGDFNRGSFDGNTARYVQGFAKFCPTDTTPPAPPTNLSAVFRSGAQAIDLSWDPSPGDDRGGQVRYELLKNDSVFASFINITTFRDTNGTPTDRYFVRATDSTGNRSATTPVASAQTSDTQNPTTPQNLQANIQGNGDVALTWTASNDNVGVTGYRVLRTGAQLATTGATNYTDSSPGSGSYWYQVQAFDAAGNESFRTSPVRVDINANDTQNPTTPQNLQAALQPDGSLVLTWDAATDNVGVVEYQIYRNNVPQFTVGGSPARIPVAPQGSTWWQVQARDAAGNEGFKTSPIRIDNP